MNTLFKYPKPVKGALLLPERYGLNFAKEQHASLRETDEQRKRLYTLLNSAAPAGDAGRNYHKEVATTASTYLKQWLKLCDALDFSGAQCRIAPAQPGDASQIDGLYFAWHGSPSLRYFPAQTDASGVTHPSPFPDQQRDTSLAFETVMVLVTTAVARLNQGVLAENDALAKAHTATSVVGCDSDALLEESLADAKEARHCNRRAFALVRLAMDRRIMFSEAPVGPQALAELDPRILEGLFHWCCARALLTHMDSMVLVEAPQLTGTQLALKRSTYFHGVHAYATVACAGAAPYGELLPVSGFGIASRLLRADMGARTTLAYSRYIIDEYNDKARSDQTTSLFPAPPNDVAYGLVLHGLHLLADAQVTTIPLLPDTSRVRIELWWKKLGDLMREELAVIKHNNAITNKMLPTIEMVCQNPTFFIGAIDARPFTWPSEFADRNMQELSDELEFRIPVRPPSNSDGGTTAPAPVAHPVVAPVVAPAPVRPRPTPVAKVEPPPKPKEPAATGTMDTFDGTFLAFPSVPSTPLPALPDDVHEVVQKCAEQTAD